MKVLHSSAIVASLLLSMALPVSSAPTDTGRPSAKWWLHVRPQPGRVTEATVEQIRPGLTKSAVKALIGPPEHVMHFSLSDTTAWDYDYRDPWGYDSTFSVVFDASGFVVSRISIREQS